MIEELAELARRGPSSKSGLDGDSEERGRMPHRRRRVFLSPNVRRTEPIARMCRAASCRGLLALKTPGKARTWAPTTGTPDRCGDEGKTLIFDEWIRHRRAVEAWGGKRGVGDASGVGLPTPQIAACGRTHS